MSNDVIDFSHLELSESAPRLFKRLRVSCAESDLHSLSRTFTDVCSRQREHPKVKRKTLGQPRPARVLSIAVFDSPLCSPELAEACFQVCDPTLQGNSVAKEAARLFEEHTAQTPAAEVVAAARDLDTARHLHLIPEEAFQLHFANYVEAAVLPNLAFEETKKIASLLRYWSDRFGVQYRDAQEKSSQKEQSQ